MADSPRIVERQVYNAILGSLLGIHRPAVSESQAIGEVIGEKIRALAAAGPIDSESISALVRGLVFAARIANINPETVIACYCEVLTSNKAFMNETYEEAKHSSAKEFLNSVGVLGHAGLKALSESFLADHCDPQEIKLLLDRESQRRI